MPRVLLAFVIAPVTPALVAALLAWILPQDVLLSEPLNFVLFSTIFSPLFAVPATVLLAVPLFFWFRRRAWLELRHIIVGGVSVALLTTFVFAVFSLVSTPNFYYLTRDNLYVHWNSFREGLSYALLFVPYGVAVGCVFWLVAFWRATPWRPEA